MENENRRYILTLGYALRGWKLLPYAIQYLYAPRTEFFREDDWALISACDGQTDICWNALTDAQRERYAHWDMRLQMIIDTIDIAVSSMMVYNWPILPSTASFLSFQPPLKYSQAIRSFAR